MRPSPDFPVTDADWGRCAALIQGTPSAEECWIWVGPLTPPNKTSSGGYGLTGFRIAGQRRLVHRVAWLFFRGELGGLTIDHLCRERRCMNPWHMDPCPQGVNASRAPYFQERTHCTKGHPMDGRRTSGRQAGYVYCRTCNRETMRARRERVALGEA